MGSREALSFPLVLAPCLTCLAQGILKHLLGSGALRTTARPPGAGQHGAGLRGDRGSHVSSFDGLLEITPDGHSVRGGALWGHTTPACLPVHLEPPMLVEKPHRVRVLQERLHLLAQLQGCVRFPGNQL